MSIPEIYSDHGKKSNTWKATGVDLVNYGIGMYTIHECDIDEEDVFTDAFFLDQDVPYRYGQTASAELIDLVVTYRAASPP
jgi:hypothetical protein